MQEKQSIIKIKEHQDHKENQETIRIVKIKTKLIQEIRIVKVHKEIKAIRRDNQPISYDKLNSIYNLTITLSLL